jgi:hypothetical protein
METSTNFFVAYRTDSDPGATVDQYIVYKISLSEKKFITPGVRTSKDGKTLKKIKSIIPWQDFLKKDSVGTNNLNFIISEFFPPKSGPKIKKILGIVEE